MSKTKPISVSAAGANAESSTKRPLYMQVALELKDEIVNGVYPVGSLIPTEDELCKRFSVSRYTVREALRVLREEGLVSSRRGAGTIVVPPRSKDTDIHQVMSINDLVAFGTDTKFAIEDITMVTIDNKLALRTGLPEGEQWLQVIGYRRTENADEPVGYSEYYINRAFAAVGRILARHEGPIFPLIEDMFGQSVAEVHQQISATLISKILAAEFGVKEQSAALEIRRTYKASDDRILQITINTHPASRYRHSMTLQRYRA
ncbi:MAG: GntR family transcriptional regulator [Pseudomonadales bacterium]|nr:GntR family transcriptional regulator [Pseudomonadales bacterium]